MANTYTDILALANKNNMGLSNTIKRDYGIPLDYSSVQETYEAALAYAKTSTLAYIGQPISVGDTLYIVTDEANGYLKAVGNKPTADGKSIVVGEDGKVAMYGFEAAEGATLPQKQADGSIKWVAIDAIVSGDGNEKTRVVAAEGSDITVTPVYNDENDTYTYTLDVKFPAIPEYSITKEASTDKVTYKLTKDGVAVGEAIEVHTAYDDTALVDRVTDAEAAITEYDSRLDSVEEKVDNFFAAVENPDEIVDTLAEIQKCIADDKTGTAVMLADIKANTDAIAVLNGTGEGSVEKKIDTAITAKAAEDSGKYATQEALAAVSAKADAAAVATEVEEALADKVAKSELANYHTKEQSYSKEQVDTLLAGIKGEYGETADTVAAALDTYKSEASAKFATIDEKNETQDTTIQANADAIATLNGTGDGSVQKIVADAIAKIPATPIATSTTAGIVKASEEVTVASDGTMGVGYISTDKLIQGSDTLVLNGGSSGVVTQ